MYVAIWNKYLPIIRILLKRAVAGGEQSLDLNRIDFERAGSGRKAGYRFTVEYTRGRVSNIISNIPLAADLAAVMMDDAATKTLLLAYDYHVTLNTKFKLGIVCTNAPELSDGQKDEASDPEKKSGQAQEAE